jgi:uncharacterized membrane protein
MQNYIIKLSYNSEPMTDLGTVYTDINHNPDQTTNMIEFLTNYVKNSWDKYGNSQLDKWQSFKEYLIENSFFHPFSNEVTALFTKSLHEIELEHAQSNNVINITLE